MEEIVQARVKERVYGIEPAKAGHEGVEGEEVDLVREVLALFRKASPERQREMAAELLEVVGKHTPEPAPRGVFARLFFRRKQGS